MEGYWKLSDARGRNPLVQKFNVSPTSLVPMIHRVGNSLRMAPARWGLIPFWWKEPKPPHNAFNARSEEVFTKPMWKIPASKARCLVPALGWYAWKTVEKRDSVTGELQEVKQPYLIQRTDRVPIAFAGLMSRLAAEGDRAEFTCTILTRDAAGVSAQIHGRMPIALPKDAEGAWLDPDLTDPGTMIDFARDSALTDFMFHPVEVRVDVAKNAGLDLIGPFPNPA